MLITMSMGNFSAGRRNRPSALVRAPPRWPLIATLALDKGVLVAASLTYPVTVCAILLIVKINASITVMPAFILLFLFAFTLFFYFFLKTYLFCTTNF